MESTQPTPLTTTVQYFHFQNIDLGDLTDTDVYPSHHFQNVDQGDFTDNGHSWKRGAWEKAPS